MTRVLREALARDQRATHIFRLARLAGLPVKTPDDVDLAAEFREYANAISAYYVTPGSPPDARSRRWSVRGIFAMATLENFEVALEQVLRPSYAQKPSNLEMKILVRGKIEAMLSPGVITDRDVVMIFDDAVAPLLWGFWFQGPQYQVLLERWFDDLWASIPDRYIIYSRNGFNESAIEQIRKELAVIESAQARQSA